MMDEADAMAERDMGSTFLLPHTHLYKPDRVSQSIYTPFGFHKTKPRPYYANNNNTRSGGYLGNVRHGCLPLIN